MIGTNGNGLVGYGTKIVLTSSDYPAAKLGDTGTVVQDGYFDSIVGHYRYLVRWDSSPSMLFGVYSDSFEVVDGVVEGE